MALRVEMPMWQERYRTWNDAGRKPRRPPPSSCAGACKTYLRVQQLTPACYGSCGPFWRDCLPLLQGRPLGLLRDLRPQGTANSELKVVHRQKWSARAHRSQAMITWGLVSLRRVSPTECSSARPAHAPCSPRHGMASALRRPAHAPRHGTASALCDTSCRMSAASHHQPRHWGPVGSQ